MIRFLGKYIYNLSLSITFGFASFVLSFIQFNIPGVEGAASSFNEVPLLISILYISNPIYLIFPTLIICLNNPPEGSVVSTFIMHISGLVAFWYCYHKFVKKLDKTLFYIAYFFVGTIVYYVLLVLPILIITNQILELNTQPFGVFYISLLKSASFEITSTTLIVTLYALQYKTNQKLVTHLATVEEQIKQRTTQLSISIEDLNSANEALSDLNNHLDALVSGRTKELENRNIQLTGYAFVNSHLLRAPLARILGLSSIMKDELISLKESNLLDKFLLSCQELDKIVNLMGDIVTEESVLDRTQIEDLQEQIRLISQEIAHKK